MTWLKQNIGLNLSVHVNHHFSFNPKTTSQAYLHLFDSLINHITIRHCLNQRDNWWYHFQLYLKSIAFSHVTSAFIASLVIFYFGYACQIQDTSNTSVYCLISSLWAILPYQMKPGGRRSPNWLSLSNISTNIIGNISSRFLLPGAFLEHLETRPIVHYCNRKHSCQNLTCIVH